MLERESVSRRINPEKIAALRNNLRRSGGCSANVCFAIDGSGAISDEEFLNEKNFVLDVVSVIAVDQPVELAAAQYATPTRNIHRLTSDIASFILAVQGTTQLKGRSKLAGGVNYCFSQLASQRRHPNKLVLLGDGRSDLGSDAVRRANHFRRKTGSVSVVAAGFPDPHRLLALAGGKANNVFQVSSFIDVLQLQAQIERLVENICKS